ncbi:MAG: cytochrome c oxidase subunit II [Maricaulaceae bacterium]
MSLAAPITAMTSLLGSAAAYAADYNGPVDGAIGFQEAATPVMERIVSFHNGMIMPIITFITLFVVILMGYIMFRFSEKRNPEPSKTTHHVGLEVVWTIAPVLILLALVVPSMQLLYMQDDLPETDMTIKVTGNTWNWEYAYPDHPNVESFVSNMLDEDDAKAAGKPYLLGADAPLVVPVDTPIKVLITSSNNLHSFAVPAFGVKMDAIPGRINETWFRVNPGKEGTFYGQCSELCGIKHSMMPIEIKVVSKSDFAAWVANDGAFANQLAENITMNGAAIAAAPK